MPYWDSRALPAAGALVSCAADLDTFLRAQLDPAEPSWARPSGSAACRTPDGRPIPAGIALLANSVHSTALDVFARQALRSLADR